MEKQIFSGKTKEEAKKIALKELNMKEIDLIFIEQQEKKTLFSKKCEIEVIKKTDLVNYIKEYLKTIIKGMGIDVNIEYKNLGEYMYFNIITNKSAILIGKKGHTIDAFQTLVNQVVNTNMNTYVKIQIDVADYKKKKQIRLEKLAKYTAKDVANSKCEVKLDPMNSYERRIIHNVLTNSKDVYTESIGEKPNRCIVIKPKEE